MSTSANVIEYEIQNLRGERVGHHRQNVLCKINNEPLLKYQPLFDHYILPFGYDEEEEYWVGKRMKLDKFLKNK